MSDELEVKITGLSELEERLKQLPSKLGKRIVRRCLRAGANVIRQAMIDRAPKRTGFLAEHFSIKTKLGRHDEISGQAFVGPNTMQYPQEEAKRVMKMLFDKVKTTARVSAANVARWLEFGTRKMSGKHFMTIAYETSKQEALDKMLEELRDGIADVISE